MLYQEVEKIISESKSILFVGWQYATDDCYQPIANLLKHGAKVTLLESNPQHCHNFNLYNKWNYQVEVVCGNSLDFIRQSRKFDTLIWYDGPQSVTYDQFIDFLTNCFGKIKKLIVSTPNGEICQSDGTGTGTQPWEIFNSNWTDQMWENLGFKVEKRMAESSLLAVRSLEPEPPNPLKLFVYPNARIHTYDKHNHLWNAVPMGIEGINKHFQKVSNPEEADLFYMGMISCGTVHEFAPSDFRYLTQYTDKHIFELEGDWVSNCAPPWLAKLTKSGNSSKPEHLQGPLFVRPAVSQLLSYIGKQNPNYELEFPSEKTWSFRGVPDPFGVRARAVQLAQQLGLPGEFSLTHQFGAALPLTSNNVTEYYQLLHKHLIGLCPRGAGIDSIRFYELCFFGRVPVAISDAKWLGEDEYDMSFAFRISPSLSQTDMAQELIKIHNLPYEDLVNRGKRSRRYFEDIVVPYLKDPTGKFIHFLKRHKII